MSADDDRLLRTLLESADLDEPPAGAEHAALAALGLGMTAATTAAVVTTSQAPLATSLSTQGLVGAAKLLPAAVKLAAVIGALGVGAVLWSASRGNSSTSEPSARTRDSDPPTRASAAPARLSELPPEALEVHRDAVDLEIGDDPKARPARVESRALPRDPPPEPIAAAEAKPPPPSSLETETRLLAAARSALALGDKVTARARLREYDEQVRDGALQREADVLHARAR